METRRRLVGEARRKIGGMLAEMAVPDCFELRPAWLTRSHADALLDHMMRLSDWEQPWVQVFGRKRQPRLSRWCGPVPYHFSGQTHPIAPWTPELESLRDRLNDGLERDFNAVLANLYRDGHDTVGWHSDDEYGHGPRPFIAAVSLGATRDFRIRHRESTQAWTVPQQHGDLFIMRTESQLDYAHSLPRRAHVTEPRVSLTFREVVA